MDTIYIDIAANDNPNNQKHICVSRNITLKALIDLVSSILDLEVFRLYYNNKILTDIDQLDTYSVVYAAQTPSPGLSNNSLEASDLYDKANSETRATDDISSLKAVVVGENFAGKTSFSMRFIHNTYKEEYAPTSICAEYYSTMNVEGSDIDVSLLDITEGFVEAYGSSWLIDRQLFIIAIELEQLNHWKTILQKYMALSYEVNPSLTFVTITKVDIIEKYTHPEKKKLLALMKQLEAYSESHNLIVFRTSAKTNKRINSPFVFALKRLQSIRIHNLTQSLSFVDAYYKKPSLFRLFDNTLKACKNKICKP